MGMVERATPSEPSAEATPYDEWLGEVRYRDRRIFMRSPTHLVVGRDDVEPSPNTAPGSIVGGVVPWAQVEIDVPLGCTEDEFFEWVFVAVVVAEEHEVGEHLLIRGDARFNPHRRGFKGRVVPPGARLVWE